MTHRTVFKAMKCMIYKKIDDFRSGTIPLNSLEAM